jgi:hypothetical protein
LKFFGLFCSNAILLLEGCCGNRKTELLKAVLCSGGGWRLEFMLLVTRVGVGIGVGGRWWVLAGVGDYGVLGDKVSKW